MNFEICCGFQQFKKFLMTSKVRLFLTLSELFGITLQPFAMGDPVQYSVDTKKKPTKSIDNTAVDEICKRFSYLTDI